METLTTLSFLLITGALSSLCTCIGYHFNFWCRQKIPEVRPTLLIGNVGDILTMRKSSAETIRDLYNHPQARNSSFIGIYIFHKPALLIREPELIKLILVKDFSKFCNRYSNSDGDQDPLGSQNLFFLKNPDWKDVRLKLTPFFTTKRLKHMFHLIQEIGQSLDRLLQNCNQHDSFDMKELCAWYTTDVIASVAFGVNANTLTNPKYSDFRHHGRTIFQFTLRRSFDLIVVFFLPQLVPYLRLQVIQTAQTKFFRSVINYIVQERESSGSVRNDLIDILIEFKHSMRDHRYSNNRINNSCGKSVFNDDMLVAQAVLFFTAGFESSSSTMAFALYELSMNLPAQQRLRCEIRNALIQNNGYITQNLIDSLGYMQMVIYEVLRLYPPLPFLDRECTINDDEQYNLGSYGQFMIPRGMPVYVPVYGLHMDSNYFAEPERFNPERFSIQNRKNVVPYTYMPFGIGQHSCIGERFAMLQTKIGLLYFLLNHYVEPCSMTPVRVKFDKKALILQAEGGIHVNIIKDPLSMHEI